MDPGVPLRYSRDDGAVVRHVFPVIGLAASAAYGIAPCVAFLPSS
jgi:hypothetical protein